MNTMSYKKLTHVEHILKRPDTYVGSLAPESTEAWVYAADRFQQSTCFVSPGLVKIFDEVLVNAIDQYTLRPNKVHDIRINAYPDGSIVIRNHGTGIPIKKHEEETRIWIPELIFGHLLTSSNYDDNEQRTTGGRNGYGAKLANVFSKLFKVEISDGKKTYSQTWRNNMSVCEPPVINTLKQEPFVRIEFWPDYERFGGSHDEHKIFQKRAFDTALWCPKAKVYYNDMCITVDSFEDYARLFVGNVPIAKSDGILVAYSQSGHFEQVSFVNGIATTKGGTHVDKVLNALVSEISKDKRVTVKTAQIKATLFVFVKSTLVNPTFSSQTKVECTSKITEVPEFKPKFIRDVLACGVMDELVALGAAKIDKELKKTDGAKKSKITGVPKLDDANWAGTAKSHECTLIVTEGDSAKTLAVAGLSVVGRNAYGVFPLRGKPRNVRDASTKQITDNQEFSDLKKILGLQHGRIYTSLKELRYGRLMIMTDADLDGSHIKGLVLNMIHHFWPSLLQLGFVVAMVTPVIKAGNDWFFTEDAYRKHGQRGDVKYYKGLGTSTSSEAKEYFKMIEKLTVKFTPDARTEESMTLAFAKAMADARKGWLVEHMKSPPACIPYGQVKTLEVTEFIHRDMANFSVEDIKRSIPHVADGLKPSQRKVIYACLKRNLTKDMKVAQLSGYVAEHTAYHHGEASLQGTIIGLAQNFVGANNIPLLEPSGQFGTRLMGGKDAASPRYIFTRLSEQTRKIFNVHDEPILKYSLEDGQRVEPDFYLPIVPMVLVNGAEGIGTGFSSYIPPYDYRDIVTNILCVLTKRPMVPMKPYFKGFTGTVEKTGEHTWTLTGVYKKESDHIRVTELPPGKWIQDYKESLDSADVRYENHSTEVQADFKIWWPGEQSHKALGLVKTIHTSNMYLMTPKGIQKYASPEEILVDYTDMRLQMYAKRKDHLVQELKKEADSQMIRARFIQAVASGKLCVFQRPRGDIEHEMSQLGFPHELLVSVRTYQYTAEEIQKAQRRAVELREELSKLEGTSVSSLWKQDLGAL